MEDECPLMMKRSGTPAPWKVGEFGCTSGSVLVKSEAVVEVEPVSRSVSHAEEEAAEAPSPSDVATSDFEPVQSPSRSVVEPLCRGASPASLS